MAASDDINKAHQALRSGTDSTTTDVVERAAEAIVRAIRNAEGNRPGEEMDINQTDDAVTINRHITALRREMELNLRDKVEQLLYEDRFAG